MRRQPADADADDGPEMRGVELRPERRRAAEEVERQLDQVHPEEDREGRLGRGQRLRRDRRRREAERRGEHHEGAGLQRLEAGPQHDEDAGEAEPDRRRPGVAVMRSRRNSTASSATQAGAVNSSANTVASGKQRDAERPGIGGAEMDEVAR